MSDTTFSAGTVIASSWLQDVNNMRYKSGSGNGADAVLTKYSGTGGAARTVQNKLAEIISVKDFGAVGDGVTDDYTALNNAFQSTGKLIFIPAGTYKYNTALTAPQCAAIIGEGELVVTLKPGASLTKGLSLSQNNYLRHLEGFTIDGTLTTNATGLYAGDTTPIACSFRRIQVKNFTGTNAVGIRIDQILKSSFYDCTTYANQIGMIIAGSSGGFPTTLMFQNCVFTNSSDIGVKITVSGGSIRFNGCDFESATNEGLKIIPGVGQTAVGLVFDQCWWEACNSVGNYMAVVDGNAALTTAEAVFQDCYFATSGGTAKALKVTGTFARVSVRNPTFSSIITGGISVESSAICRFDEWSPRYSATQGISNTSGYALGVDGPEVSWTPTYTANGGGTFTAITTNLARYRYIGSNLLKIDLTFTGTIAGTVSSIDVQLYSAGVTGPGSNWGSIAVINTGGTAQAGTVSNPTSTANLRFQKLDGSNLAAGTFSAYGTFIMEITA